MFWYVHHKLFAEYELASIYVGGGTPSVATDELVRLIASVRARLPCRNGSETTVEVNPGTITCTQFQQLLQVGFNRISIGLQALHDEELKCLGRIHTAEEAVQCVEGARNAGFQNINIDLMFGIPGSTLATWDTTLRHAIALKPEHFSIYNLSIEEGTPFWEQQQQGELSLPDEALQIRMYTFAIELLKEAGYEHYEISNFALPNYRSRHNQIYWRNEEYLGLGAGSHSYLKGRRYWNYSDLDQYIIHSPLKKNHSYPPTVGGEECLNTQQTIGETIMMNLRLLKGIELTRFEQRFGQSLNFFYGATLKKLCDLELTEMQENYFRLTPRGILLSNEVFQEFINT